jgi:hypothetical protein
MKIIGRNIKIGIGKESSRGTAVAPSFWIPQMDADFDDKFEHVIDESAYGIIEDSQDLKVVKKWSEGSFSGKIEDKSFGLLLLAGFGIVSSAQKSGETLVYEHTYSVQQDSEHDSLTIEIKHDIEQLKFANAMLSELSIRAELGKYVTFEAGFLAKLGVAASNTPSVLVQNNFIAKDITIKFADDVASLDSGTSPEAKMTEIKIEKNIETDDVLGDDEPADFNNKQVAITGSIELDYEATTYKDLSLAGTSKAMRIEIKDTGVTIGNSSNPTIKIDLPKVKFAEWSKSGGLNEIIKQTLGFKALYDLSEAKMVDLVLTNLQASY